MIAAQVSERELLCHRILAMPDKDFNLVKECIDDLEAHEPNEETIKVLEDSETGRNLSKVYDDVEEMLSDLLLSANAYELMSKRGYDVRELADFEIIRSKALQRSKPPLY
jgi:hypothetical protein